MDCFPTVSNRVARRVLAVVTGKGKQVLADNTENPDFVSRLFPDKRESAVNGNISRIICSEKYLFHHRG